MAKILAACLNCEQGPTVEPCGICESCRAIASAASLDVIEMDAASNNSVDDIRDLRERVAYAPVSGRHKVYILDEAHMLSSQAWNAFLKTLEEPPPHTIFVLATTEAGKVLPTVVDRCHRFDFARPSVEEIATVVTRVAAKESIAIDPDAVGLLARHATGSFRDALGTLEQLLSYAGTEAGARIAARDVLAVLGVTDAELLFATLEAIGSGQADAALRAAARLTETGRDPSGFVRDLEAHARDLLVVQTLGEVPAEVSVTPDRDARLRRQSERLGAGDRHAPARPAGRHAGGHAQRGGRAHAARARAREGVLSRRGPVDAGPARARGAPGGRPGDARRGPDTAVRARPHAAGVAVAAGGARARGA